MPPADLQGQKRLRIRTQSHPRELSRDPHFLFKDAIKKEERMTTVAKEMGFHD